ncbi:unnamed protein product [Clavelina lepadiformis]|uniref:Uncharacterized protein n=1 Tax=Clavelina lepadiformis TaxID=159417 RepID=A0ABP0GEJ3_CLALP
MKLLNEANCSTKAQTTTTGPQHLRYQNGYILHICRDPPTFHVTIDDGDSAAMTCWRSWSSSNLIPRLTRVMVHWHPYHEAYQSRNYRRFTEAETGSDAEYVFGVGI